MTPLSRASVKPDADSAEFFEVLMLPQLWPDRNLRSRSFCTVAPGKTKPPTLTYVLFLTSRLSDSVDVVVVLVPPPAAMPILRSTDDVVVSSA